MGDINSIKAGAHINTYICVWTITIGAFTDRLNIIRKSIYGCLYIYTG